MTTEITRKAWNGWIVFAVLLPITLGVGIELAWSIQAASVSRHESTWAVAGPIVVWSLALLAALFC